MLSLLQRFRRPVVVSFPKSGRTWLRVMLDDLGVSAVYTHAGSDHRLQRKPGELDAPSTYLGKRKVIFLHRDPRDTVVSGYLQATKRINVFEGPIGAFIRDERHGMEKIMRFNAMWLDQIKGRRDVLAVTYEDLRNDGIDTMREILTFLGKRVDEGKLQKVLAQYQFENMRKMEAGGGFDTRDGNRLRPGDRTDPESFKVRRGKIGGWRDYLDESDAEYCREVMDRFGLPEPTES